MNPRAPVMLYSDIGLEFNGSFQLNVQISSVAAASQFVEQFTTGVRRGNVQAKSHASQPTEPSADAASQKTWAATILGVNVNANSDEIVVAYRRLAQMYHPDKVASLAPEFQELATQKMKDINRAFSILK